VTPGGKPLDQLFHRHLEANDRGTGEAAPFQHPIQKPRLLERAGITIEDGSGNGIPRQLALHQAINDIVSRVIAAGEDRREAAPQMAAGVDFGTEQVAGRNRVDSQPLPKTSGLRPLAATRRPE
jgi:hypothetical protein